MFKVELKTSPHLRSAPGVEEIMRNVVWALLPLCAFSVWQFGVSAAALIVTVVLACLATEYLFGQPREGGTTLRDWSAAITGILLALTLPPGLPLWMGAVAGVAAIGLGKLLFGGLGFNVFNPALVGRAFIQAAFPAAVTTWTPAYLPNRFVEFIPTTFTLPFTSPQPVDTYTGATPLGQWKFEGVTVNTWDLLTGATAGSLGETSAILVLLCGAYLAIRRFLDWRIPAAMLTGAFVTGGIIWLIDGSYPDPFFVLLSGGLMLGAVFMASDMVASPVTPRGVWIYGGLMGFLTVIIRFFGGMPEGVMYAILLGNAASPLIEAVTQPRVYGARRGKEAK